MPAHVSIEVESLINWMQTFEFVLMGTIWFKLLQSIKQKSNIITLDEETLLFKNLLSDLQRIWDSWELILQESRFVTKNLHGMGSELQEEEAQKSHKCLWSKHICCICTCNSKAKFKVNVFNIALDTLIHEINSRFASMNSINEMFSFIWKFEAQSDSNDKAKKLCSHKHYPKDLNTDDFVGEI